MAIAFLFSAASLFAAHDPSLAPASAALHLNFREGEHAGLSKMLEDLLRGAGYRVTRITSETLCLIDTVASDHYDLLVLPDASSLPMRSIPAVQRFLGRGGDLLALNTPGWRKRLIHVGGTWQTVEEHRQRTAAESPPHVFLDFSRENLEDWHRSGYLAEAGAHYSLVEDGPAPGVWALKVDMPHMENWDSACRNLPASPFPPGHSVTVFAAKGGPGTNQLAVEWKEKDGSRWIAVVPLTEAWQRYMLLPQDFKFWESVPSRQAGCLDVSNVDMLAFTLAYTHTGHLHGAHRFQVAQVGTAPFEEDHRELLGEISAPILDIVSPAYKFFDMSGASTLNAAADQWVIPAGNLPLPRGMRAIHPRPEASGFDKERPWRWLPLLEALSPEGDLRGYPAAMLAHADGPYQGGVWASFGIEDDEWYLSEGGAEVLRHVLKRMRAPIYLLDAGANFYTYFEGQEVLLGAHIMHVGTANTRTTTLRIVVTDSDGREVYAHEWADLSLDPGKALRRQHFWKPEDWPRNGYTVVAELVDGDVRLDAAAHEIHVWRPNPKPAFVTAENGRFMLDGKRWRPHGVNYMPSSGIAVEWQDYFEYWLGKPAYHPKVIQRDLERCVAMGCNALSIFIYRHSMESQNLLDLLRRMDRLGLKANLSLRPGTPMEFPYDMVKEMIEYYRLAENDTVFAYDLAWEPQFRSWERDPFNPEWEAWIIERYGSLENAEVDWDFPVPRDAEGRVVNFSPHMISNSGPWNRMIAAYRRFLDTLLYEKYAEARRLVRAIDPHRLVSFRMSMAGDPTDTQTEALLYDFAYLGGAVDIFEPEGYGRIGDWDRVKPGWFTYEYARWANPRLPVLWAEAGVHVWDMAHMRPSQERLEFQGTYYADFYRMLIQSGADGIFWWWYPGGYRANEKSDYGVINPDGTDRPVTRVIRSHAPLFKAAPDARPVDTWLMFDRDAHNDGLTGIYRQLEAAFWDAVEKHRVPGLKTEGSGTDSTTCPALAVGNTPLTGSNPPKFLDAYLDQVRIKVSSGEWVSAPKGGTLYVKQGEPIKARVTLTNLGEATWAPPAQAANRPGGVFLVIDGDINLRIPLQTALARFEQAEMEVTLAESMSKTVTRLFLTLDAEGRARFGPKYEVTLVTGTP